MSGDKEEVYVMTQKGSLKQTGEHGVMNPIVFKTFEDIENYVNRVYVNKNLGWEIEHCRNPRWHGVGLITIVRKEDGKVTNRAIFNTFISEVATYE